MTVKINADTTNGAVITSDTSGEIELQAGGTKIATVKSTGLEMASGKNLVTTAPAFSAYVSSNQTIATSTFTIMPLDTVNFDTTSDFDNVTNYRYTPSVEGYYLVKCTGTIQNHADGTITLVTIDKNGAEVQRGTQSATGSINASISIATALVYMNGTTDYLSFDVYHNHGSSRNLLGAQRYANAEAVLVRAV